MDDDLILEALEEIGPLSTEVEKEILDAVQKVLAEEGYDVARIFIDKSAVPGERGELRRILAICEKCELSPDITAEVFRKLNRIEPGMEHGTDLGEDEEVEEE